MDAAGEGRLNDRLRLYSYWRSSAAYRVRIGLNLKGLPFETVPVHLLRDGGEQHSAEFREANAQGLVPVLQHGNRTLRQSLAILETWTKPGRRRCCCPVPRGAGSACARLPRSSPATSIP